MIKNVGELKKALEPYPDDMMITVADWEDMYHFIDQVNHLLMLILMRVLKLINLS